WAALDALAHLAQPASTALFKERLADKDPYLRRAAAEGLGRLGDSASIDELVRNATTDDAEMVRMAMAFALAKLGRNYVTRIVDTMDAALMLSRDFYNRATLKVARDLIGKVLVHDTRAGLASGIIVEAEAYIGESDKACHAAPGPTARNAPLYGPPGMAYVYLNYGIHY